MLGLDPERIRGGLGRVLADMAAIATVASQLGAGEAVAITGENVEAVG